MEELRKLESLQRTLTFMESRSFVSSSADSNRFFANLIVLLLQPCGQLNLNTKCTLLSEYIPKISVKFLEEALEWVGLENGDKDSEENFVHLNNPPDDKTDFSSCQINHKGLAMVGLESMERANSTLEDFCRSYFMFHGMDIDSPQAVFKYLPVLSFTESYIYQLDGLNEKILYIPTGVTTVAKKLEKVEYHNFATNVFEENPFKPLLNILDSRGLLTERIKEELRSGEDYWALERKLCCALMHKTEISTEDVMRAIHLKSFDYRVLNLLLYKLRGEEVNDLHMEFLSVSEFLVEISDDLFDYEDDVLENNFNILRMFVKIYGPITAPAILVRYISNAEEKYDKLLKTLDPRLSSKYQRRCEEATKEGGKVSDHPLGTWNIPPVIVNEDLYRSNCLNTEECLGF